MIHKNEKKKIFFFHLLFQCNARIKLPLTEIPYNTCCTLFIAVFALIKAHI